MIKSKLEKTIIKEEYSHFEYILYLNHIIIGEYELTIEDDLLIFAIFKIRKEFRKKGYGKYGLIEVDKSIQFLKEDYNFKYIEVDINSFDNGHLNDKELSEFYVKYFNVSPYFIDAEKILMRKEA